MTKHMSPDERSEQILDAAKKCFIQNGYFDTKMDEIAKESGLSKGGVYFHFDSKRDIFRSLVQAEYDRAMGFVDSVIVGEGELPTKLMRLGEHFTELFSTTDNPRFMTIVTEMALRDEEISAVLLEMQTNYVAKITELIEWAIDEGQLRQVEAKPVAFLLKAMLDGIQFAYAAGVEVDLDHVLGAGLDMVVNGLMPPK